MKYKKENQANECSKISKLQITVPFLWEERPGAPKEEWKRKREPLPPAPFPVKYVASVPFKWEEKPGTPLRCFASEPKGVPETENKCLPLPPRYHAKYESMSDGESSYADDYYDLDWMTDFEALDINKEETFGSAPSLLANRLAPRETISSAVPMEQQTLFVNQHHDGVLSTPSSSGSATSSSSYGTGNTSPRGVPFLEHLFPLYSPNSGFLNKTGNYEESVEGGHERGPPTLAEHRKLVSDYRERGVTRRSLTLGELIMLSRRREYRRTAIHMKKYNNRPKDLTENQTPGCFKFESRGGGIAKLLRRDLLSLNLT